MDILKQVIREKAKVLNDELLNLDLVLNHLVDPRLVMKAEICRSVPGSGDHESDDDRVFRNIRCLCDGIPSGRALRVRRRKKTLITDEDCFCGGSFLYERNRYGYRRSTDGAFCR